MLSMFLKLSGHEPVGALSVNQAWDRLAYDRPELVLLDIMLPDGNGLEMCRDLRAKPETAALPIIMISAHAPPMIAEATKVGANGYLPKPIKLDALITMLGKAGVR